MAAGFAPPPLTRAAGVPASSSVSRAVKTAPSAAVPSEPPIERNRRRARGRDAEIGVVDGVLHREHEHLHHQPEPEAQHEHRGVRVQRRRAGVELRVSSSIPIAAIAVPAIGNTL